MRVKMLHNKIYEMHLKHTSRKKYIATHYNAMTIKANEFCTRIDD